MGDDVYGDFILNKEFNKHSMKASTTVDNQGNQKRAMSNTYKRLYLHASSYALSISYIDSSSNSCSKRLYDMLLVILMSYIVKILIIN